MKFILSCLFLLFCFTAKAQSVSPDNRMVVIGHATLEVPADQVRFSVSLQSIDSVSMDKVYQLHQQKEDKLVKLLQDMQIPASTVNYSLLSVSRQQDYSNRKRNTYLSGNQTVNFILRDISKFSELQARLIKEGFTDFHSTFTSSELANRKTEVIEKAIEVAKAKAEVMAKAANLKIKRIVKIADTEDTDPTFLNYNQAHSLAEVVETSADLAQLMRYPQNIPVSAQVKVVFEVK